MIADATAATPRRPRVRNPLRRPMLRAFIRTPSGALSFVILGLVGMTAILAPRLLSSRANGIQVADSYLPPSREHLLGTDDLGRDVLARTLVATELSLKFAIGAAVVALVVGATLGIAVAVLPPRTRPLLQRFIDTMIAFPGLIVVIFISTIFGTGAKAAMAGVGVAASFGFARFVSTYALSIGGRDFVHAARLTGVSRVGVMTKHILPNVVEPLVIALSFILTFGLLANAGLSFLGLGVQPPQYDWGQLLTDGVRAIYVSPALALGPAAALAITALAFGFFAEALARAMNPLLWNVEPSRSRSGGDTSALPESSRDAIGTVSEESDPPLVEVRDLVVTFPEASGSVDVVKGVSFSLAAGETLGVVGESGSGKTMTALAIARLVPYPGRTSGTVMVNGRELALVRRAHAEKLLGTDVAFVFQDPTASLNPALSIGRQLTEAVEVHKGMKRGSARELAQERLREVHIPAPETQLGRYPHEFSGGMRQRAVIAMGLMGNPSLLICDEPTTALDVTIQAQIMELLAEINRTHGTAVILISHNLALVAQNCDRILVMYAGRVVEELTKEQLLEDPRHPYTRALLQAVPDIRRPRDEPLAYIAGETPDPAEPLPGCAFAPRCPLRVERCLDERPPLIASDDGRRIACWVASSERDAC